jgi:hypothetical protein
MQKVQPAVTLSTKHKFPAGTPGIPAGFVTGFAHGETEEFSKAALPPNRRATVHVPALPSVPKKLPKAPGASLKSGPTYKPNGPLKATLTKTSKTRWRKRATFHMAAEFDDAPAKGTLASCGEIRQYIRWSSDAVDPGKVGHEGFFTDKTYLANTWYEDRHQRNIRYGHRRGPHTFKGGVVNQYLNAKKKPDFLKGAVYQGRDRPSFGSSPARVTAFTGSWEFRLVALDVCRNSVLGDDTVTVLF